MTTHRIAEENQEARALLPPQGRDGSRIGVNYVDAYLKPLNTELPDGRRVTFKRKGLKILVGIGDRKGEAIMRRIEHGPDEATIFSHALTAAVNDAGASLRVTDGTVFLEEA